MSITLKTCYGCGRVIEGTLGSDNKKPKLTGECKKCKEKRERESGKDDKD